MKNGKFILSFLVAILMAALILPVPAYAEGEATEKEILELEKEVLITASGTETQDAQLVAFGSYNRYRDGRWLLWNDGTLTFVQVGKDLSWTNGEYPNGPWEKYLSQIKRVVIPEGVTTLGTNTFKNFYNMTSVSIPSSVTSIGFDCFRDCKSLTSLTLPEGVVIEDQAFLNCSSLTKLVIPEGVTRIGRMCFRECTSLTEVTIPKTVEILDDFAFYKCMSLTDVIIEEGVTSLGHGCFGNCRALTNITIPKSVTSIGGTCFGSCYSLAKVVIPEGVTKIESSTFLNCSGLTSVVIPQSVKSIGESAFSGCRSLTSVKIPDGITALPKSTFSGCKGLTDVVLPETITSLGADCFRNCISLSKITIPESVTSVGETCFAECESLNSVTFCGSAPSIGTNAFNKVSATMHYDLAKTGWNQIAGKQYGGLLSWGVPAGSGQCGDFAQWQLIDDGSLIISGVGEMTVGTNSETGEYGYPWRENRFPVRTVTIEPGITGLCDYAFSQCDQLTSVELPDTLNMIGEQCFSECTSLKAITIPGYVNRIGNYAFYGCTSLASAKLPISDCTLGDYVFAGCPALKSVSLKYVSEMGSACFLRCTGLESITLSDTMTVLNTSSFYLCSSLKSIVIPECVTDIGVSCFNGCTSLTKVIFQGEAPYIAANAFQSVTADALAKLYLPSWADAQESYGGNLTWKSRPLSKPALSSVSNVSGGVTVKWNRVADAARYEVYYKTANGSWTSAGTTSSSSFTVKKLTSGTKYYFTVRAYSVDKISRSELASSKSLTYIAAPSLPSVSNTTEGVKVSWTAVKGAANYRVLYKTSGGSWKAAGTTTGTSFTVKGLKSGTKYFFTIRCVNKDNTAATSGCNTTGRAITYIAAPALPSLSAGVSSVKVSWKAVPGAVNYRVMYKTSGGSWKTAGTTTGTSLTVKDLTAGTKYFFTVRCVNKDNTKVTSGYNSTGKSITWYKVTYNANGGTNAPSAQAKTNGKTLTLRTATPTRKGYTFKGWATSKTGDVKYKAGGSYTANSAKTLYAKWTANKYTIKFNGNGKTSGTMSAMTGRKYGTSYTLTANAYTRTGYNFVGWNTKADGSGTSYTDKASVKNLSSKDGGSITLYAQWKLKTYKVTYDANGGTGAPSAQTKTYGKTLTLRTSVPTRKGYTFKGWATSASGDVKYKAGSSYTANSAKTLYAKWTANKYTIKFNGNGKTSGTMSAMTGRKYGTSYTLTANAYTRTGYNFVGWNTKADGSGTSYTDKASVMNLSSKDGGSITLYAQWKLKTYKVTFDANGGKDAPSAKTKTYGKTLTLPTTKPTRSGYTFQGWATSKTGSVKYKAGASYTANSSKTLYAVWKKK